MPDFLHWSAALLAVLGLGLWLWSGIRVPKRAASVLSQAHLKQHIGRVAIFAAVVSALLQAVGGSPPPTQYADYWLLVSVTPPADVSVGASLRC
jgi:hypothetical protein